MKKKIIIAAIAVGLVLAAAGIYTYIVFFGETEAHIAEIKLDGQVIRTIDLRNAGNESFTIESEHGWNLVCVENGKIFVREASCPDKICVNHGPLHSEFLPIVCLPNKLEISLK